jgi:hypothetical protein
MLAALQKKKCQAGREKQEDRRASTPNAMPSMPVIAMTVLKLSLRTE